MACDSPMALLRGASLLLLLLGQTGVYGLTNRQKEEKALSSSFDKGLNVSNVESLATNADLGKTEEFSVVAGQEDMEMDDKSKESNNSNVHMTYGLLGFISFGFIALVSRQAVLNAEVEEDKDGEYTDAGLNGGNPKHANNDVPIVEAEPVPHPSTKLIAFFGLVLVQGAHVLFFRLSQIGGRYHYNTASAIAVTEAIKFVMSAGLYYWGSERMLPSLKVILSYTICAMAYAINNQLAMYLLTSMSTGVFQMGKSAAPILTALTMWIFYEDEKFNKLQGVCFIVLTLGLVTLFGAQNSGSMAVQDLPLAWLIISVSVTAVTSVYNARVLQRGACSMHMQNMCLYSQGFVFNLIMYFTGINATGNSSGFFDGYSNVFVLFVLLSQSFMGLAISAVYKYGDAIIKCLAASLQACVLLVLDVMLFKYHFSLAAMTGAGVVIATTYIYFAVALPMLKQEQEEAMLKPPEGQSMCTKAMRAATGVTFGAALAGTAAYVATFYV
eukprot:jgi/Bigna1/84982/estExt_fgenesh1_pg.C_10527